jgi:hypothetical protein
VTQLLSLALWFAGAGHFALLGASGQIPARLGWRTELPRMSVANRKLFLVATGYVVLTYLAFGVLTLVLHDELVRGDRAAIALAAFIGLYWLVRLVLDATWFGHGEWPRGWRFVLAHVAIDGLFAFFTVVYGGLAVWQLIR